MCVAFPGRVLSLEGQDALVDFRGSRRKARLGLTEVKVGDRVLVHAGCVLQVVSDEEADEMDALFDEIGMIK